MEPTRPDQSPDRPSAEPTDAAPAYEKPALTNYGSLARLTRSTPGTLVDAMGVNRRTCL